MQQYPDPVAVLTEPVPFTWRGALGEVAVEVEEWEAGKAEAQHCAAEKDDWERAVNMGSREDQMMATYREKSCSLSGSRERCTLCDNDWVVDVSVAGWWKIHLGRR